MKLGIVGSGKIVHYFLPAAIKIKNLSLVGISSTPRSAEILKDLQQKYHIEHTYTDNKRMFANPDIDTIYVAVPNVLHYQICEEALEAGKNVICEKPFVYTTAQARSLKKLADQKGVFITEAITNIYLPNFKLLKENLHKLGPIHIINFNYTQYSTRYHEFKKGNILPVFDPKKGGGALMDLGIYDIHLAVGLFGEPDSVEYLPNMQQGTDTSGVIIMQYPQYLCLMMAVKDSYADAKSYIEGENGSLVINGLIDELPSLDLQLKDQNGEYFNENKYDHRMISEFENFVKVFDEHDIAANEAAFDHSIQVLNVLGAVKASFNSKGHAWVKVN